MGNFKRFVYENKKEIIAFAGLVLATILLCIPFILGYAVKVFGWAVWFYLFAGYVALFLRWKKKSVNLTTRSAVWLVLSIFFILATLHVACLDKSATRSFPEYIVDSYEYGSAGGAVLGIVTSPIAVLFTYVWAIVFFIVLTAVSLFFFLRPFIFAGTVEPIRKKTKKKASGKPVCREVILDEAPFLVKKKPVERSAPVSVMTTAEDSEDPRELLFGGQKEIYTSKEKFSYDGLYDTHPYVFSKPSDQEEVTDEEATEILFGKDEVPDVSDFDCSEPEEEESILFDDEKDESIIDLLGRPTNTPFFQALTQNTNEKHAPSPIEYAQPNEEVAAEEAIEAEESPVSTEESPTNKPCQPTPTEAPEGAPVSTKYVFYNGEFVPVMDGASVPTPQATVKQPTAVPLVSATVPETEEEPQTARKIVQLVKRPDKPYNKPPVSILKNHVTQDFIPTVDNWDELQEVFEVKLKNFGVDAKLVDAVKGPTVTLCALELGDKCPIARLNSVKTDLQRWLKSTKPIAIIPQLPGTDYCGVQIPNTIKSVVGFKEILSSKEYREAKGDIKIALGKTAEGEILIEDLAAMPHALIAGSTGSGKSVCINVIISSIIFNYTPDEVKILLIDLKEVEMAPYAELPHMLLKEALSQKPEIINTLKWIRKEVADRFNLFKSMHIRSLNEYNAREDVEKLPRIVIIIDEASELMTDPNSKKSVENTLSSLARIARAAGVHLIFATQNPVKEVITNEIQNNLNTKIAFAVGDYVHSQVIFKAKGAECLIGKGDMYIKRGQEMVRAQCAYIDTTEIEDAVQYIKENNEYEFNEEEIQKILNGASTDSVEESKTVTIQENRQPGAKQEREEEEDSGNEPDIMWKALKICVDENYVSCSYLQRKLKKGYNTVANIVEQLAAEGYITAVPQGSKEKREILISKEDFYREWESRYGTGEDEEDVNFDE